MKRLLSSFSLLFAFIAAMAGCAKREPADELERIHEAKFLHIAVDPVNLPFCYTAGTNVVGFDADLAQAIARKLNVPIKWVKKDFGGLFQTLDDKKADIIVSVITITEERKKRFAFSEPYFQSGQILAVRKGDEKQIRKLEDLNGKKVGVWERTSGHAFAESEPRLKGAEIIPCGTIDTALENLNERIVDGVIAGFPTLSQTIEESFPNLTIIGKPLNNEQKGVVVRKGEDRLLQVANDTIQELKSQGKLEEMGKKWFKKYDRIKQLQSQVPGQPLG